MENHQPGHEQLYPHDDQDEEHDDYLARLPTGYRFLPDDVQLIEDYLKKIVEHPERGRVYGIFTVNLYGYGPDELTAAHKEQCENNWYFFTQRNRKYANGKRPARGAGIGYWKQTNIVQPIIGVDENKNPVKIGRKITLDYCYKKNREESRTEWKMNEYRLDGRNLPTDDYSTAGSPEELNEWCLCRIYKGKGSKRKKNKNTHVKLQVEAEPSSGTQLIASQEHNEHVAGELDANFTGQSTAAAFSNQHIIAREQYNGLNAGGPGPNFIQQSTNLPYSNDNFWKPNNSDYMANVASGSMNGLHYTTDDLVTEYQDSYPVTGTMYENTGYVQPIRSLPPSGIPTWSNSDINQSSSNIAVQPIRSLPPSGIPTWSNSDINQSSSSIADYFTSGWEFNFPSSSFPGNGQSSSDADYIFADLDQFGNQNL